MTYSIYTDGTGLGGWGYVVYDDSGREVATGKGHIPTMVTNNRAEVEAAIHAVRYIAAMQGMGNGERASEYVIYSDSQYVVSGLSGAWEINTNKDLWEVFRSELAGIEGVVNIRFEHVPGHKGVKGNERADRLARQGAEERKSKRDVFGRIRQTRTYHRNNK